MVFALSNSHPPLRIGVTERGDGGLQYERVLDALQRRRVQGAIVITKAPHLLVGQDVPGNVIIHCTITGYGGTAMEPNVCHAATEVLAYRELVRCYGGERVVLRVDPVCWWSHGPHMAASIIGQALGRVRISFIDLYPHVRARFLKAGIAHPGVDRCEDNGIHAPLGARIQHYRDLNDVALHSPGAQTLELCSESDMLCTGCVSQRDLDAMGITWAPSGDRAKQRSACQCMAEKVELLQDKYPCPFQCAYCYWCDQKQ
jgi:Domain of unknown function (DUF1848)